MKKKYTFLESAWWITKRFLRTAVPQIPAALAYATEMLPKDALPYLVFGGAVLTALDKLLRDKGLYK